MNKIICIDPPSNSYKNNKLFDVNDNHLNRDGSLIPYFELKKLLNNKGYKVLTSDLINFADVNSNYYYYSLGNINNFERFKLLGAKLMAIVIMEPPIVDSKPYDLMSKLSDYFEKIYSYDISPKYKNLQRFYFTQYRKSVIHKYWSNNIRINKLVLINSSHKPLLKKDELYSKRIDIISLLSKTNSIDLYGRGWGKWYSRSNLWKPYWSNISSILNAYKGSCISKYEVLKDYNFAICFENMIMPGFISEKIFDCFYSGTIPIYLGDPNISDTIPSDTFIDYRDFSNINDLLKYLDDMPKKVVKQYKDKGRDFIESAKSENFRNSLMDIFNV